MVKAAIIISIILYLAWKWGPRRRREGGFKFVYVNQDGTARELSPEEVAYLSQKFSGGDSGRPYIKASYESTDGWGSQSGFIERHRVPSRIVVRMVTQNSDFAVKGLEEDFLGSHRAAGDTIVENADGSISCTPNPAIPRKERFELVRKYELEQQRLREEMAKI